jgi:hypothetical protein
MLGAPSLRRSCFYRQGEKTQIYAVGDQADFNAIRRRNLFAAFSAQKHLE